MTPADLRLSVPSWLPGQYEAIEEITAHYSSGTRVVGAPKPTGSGKTGIAAGVSRLMHELGLFPPGQDRTVILTETKGLQDQYVKFPGLNPVDMRGKSNHRCRMIQQGSYTCEDAWLMCGGVPPTPQNPTNNCAYREWKSRFESEEVGVTNYDWWTRAGRVNTDPIDEGGDGLKRGVGLLVCDEAHSADAVVCSALGVELTETKLAWLFEPHHGNVDIGWELPKKGEEFSWAADRLGELECNLDDLKARMKRKSSMDVGKAIAGTERLIDGLTRILATGGDEWVVEVSQPKDGLDGFTGGVRMEPIWAGKYVESTLFRGVPYVLLLSATMQPRKTAALLGVKMDDCAFLRGDAVFQRSRCPVWQIGSGVSLKYGVSDVVLDRAIAVADEFLGERLKLGRKGIVHTVSYPRAAWFAKHTRLRMQGIDGLRIFTHDKHTTAKTIAEYKAYQGPALLVSPSVSTGYDFPGDECRFQLVLKVPFVEAKNPIIKARCERDPKYAMYLTMIDLMQMCGRGMRSEDDWCETGILDKNVGWFMKQNRGLAPEWFRVDFRSGVPAPLVIG